MKYGDLIYCQWVDALASNEPWNEIEEVIKLEPLICHSVGWVIRDDDKCLTLAASWAEDNEESIGTWGVIPKGWVKEVRKLNYER